jgi:hypothetical protein
MGLLEGDPLATQRGDASAQRGGADAAGVHTVRGERRIRRAEGGASRLPARSASSLPDHGSVDPQDGPVPRRAHGEQREAPASTSPPSSARRSARCSRATSCASSSSPASGRP